MNIFFLDKDPQEAARYHADIHVGKMLLESCQLLSNGYRQWIDVIHPKRVHFMARETERTELWARIMETYPRETFYKKTHWNHPCSRWTRVSQQNFEWVMFLAYYLCAEWKKRCEVGTKGFKNATRKEMALVQWMVQNPPNLVQNGLRKLPSPSDDAAIRILWEDNGVVDAYRGYYRHHKKDIISPRGWYGSMDNAPEWWYEF